MPFSPSPLSSVGLFCQDDRLFAIIRAFGTNGRQSASVCLCFLPGVGWVLARWLWRKTEPTDPYDLPRGAYEPDTGIPYSLADLISWAKDGPFLLLELASFDYRSARAVPSSDVEAIWRLLSSHGLREALLVMES